MVLINLFCYFVLDFKITALSITVKETKLTTGMALREKGNFNQAKEIFELATNLLPGSGLQLLFIVTLTQKKLTVFFFLACMIKNAPVS